MSTLYIKKVWSSHWGEENTLSTLSLFPLTLSPLSLIWSTFPLYISPIFGPPSTSSSGPLFPLYISPIFGPPSTSSSGPLFPYIFHQFLDHPQRRPLVHFSLIYFTNFCFARCNGGEIKSLGYFASVEATCTQFRCHPFNHFKDMQTQKHKHFIFKSQREVSPSLPIRSTCNVLMIAAVREGKISDSHCSRRYK